MEEDEGESSEGQTHNEYVGKSYERKKCEYKGRKTYKKQHYSPNNVTYIRDMDKKCSTAIIDTRSGGELHNYER